MVGAQPSPNFLLKGKELNFDLQVLEPELGWMVEETAAVQLWVFAERRG